MQKRILIFIFSIFLITAFAVSSQAENKVRAFTCLTGGTTGCLDKVSVSALTDGDISIVVVSNVFYFYEFNDGATDAEETPDFIRPDDYSTDGVWYLVGARTGANATPGITAYDSGAPDSTDKEVGQLYWDYIDGGSTSENADFYLKSKQDGSEHTFLQFDESDDAVEIKDTLVAEVGLTILTGQALYFGSNRIDNTSDKIDGAMIEDDGIDSAQYAADSIDNEHINWADIDYLGDEGYSLAHTPDIATPSSWTMSGAAMYGGIFIATGTSTANLPDAAVGMSFSVIVEGAYTATLSPYSGDTIYLDGAAETQDEDIESSGTAGDMVVCTYRSANAWSCNSSGFDGATD